MSPGYIRFSGGTTGARGLDAGGHASSRRPVGRSAGTADPAGPGPTESVGFGRRLHLQARPRSASTNGSHRTRPSRTSSSQPIFVPTDAGPATMSATQKRRRDVLFVLLRDRRRHVFLAVLTRSMAFVAAAAARRHRACRLRVPAGPVQAAHVGAAAQRSRCLGAGYREDRAVMGPQYVRAARAVDGPRLVPLAADGVELARRCVVAWIIRVRSPRPVPAQRCSSRSTAAVRSRCRRRGGRSARARRRSARCTGESSRAARA